MMSVMEMLKSPEIRLECIDRIDVLQKRLIDAYVANEINASELEELINHCTRVSGKLFESIHSGK
jgi:hypothetical protein